MTNYEWLRCIGISTQVSLFRRNPWLICKSDKPHSKSLCDEIQNNTFKGGIYKSCITIFDKHIRFAVKELE